MGKPLSGFSLNTLGKLCLLRAFWPRENGWKRVFHFHFRELYRCDGECHNNGSSICCCSIFEV